MMQRLGELVCAHRWLVIIGWLALAALLHTLAPPWSDVALDGDLEQLPADTTTARATALRREAFPEDRAASQIVLIFARASGPLTAADREFSYDLAGRLARLPALPLVGEVWTEKTPVVGRLLTSADGRAQRAVARLSTDFMAAENVAVLRSVARLVAQQRAFAPAGLQIGVTGSAAIGGDMLTSAAESLDNTHRTTILLVITALVLIYRSPLLVVAPLAAIGLSVATSLDLLAILAKWSADSDVAWPSIRVFTTTRILVVVLLFGAVTDYCLFLISRFRENRAAGADQFEASASALGAVGVALATSALTTVVGLGMMGLAEFGKLAYSGPTIALSLLVGLACSVTLAPALLATPLGAAVGMPAIAGPHCLHGRAVAFWNWLARLVVRRPGAVLAVCLAASLPLAAIGRSTEVNYDIFSELPSTAVSRRGAALLRAHFPPGEIGPLALYAHLPGADFEGVDGRLKIAHLSKPLEELAGVSKVHSLYRPTGAPAGSVSLFTGEGLSELAAANSPLTEDAFVSNSPPYEGELTRLSIILQDEPFSSQAVATCRQIQRIVQQLQTDAASPWRGATFELLGPSIGVLELEEVTLADRRRIELLTVAGVLLVLCALLRRPVVCCYLIATVLLSYFVTLGAVELLFRAWYGASYVGLTWKAPVFLFVVLVAVGQDYNVYLVTRVFEEQERLGPFAGLRFGMVQTGGIITSCGVIMAAAFGSMMTSSLRGMVELGAALSLGILLDTLVVRSVLVPAFLAAAARWRRAPLFQLTSATTSVHQYQQRDNGGQRR